MPRLTSHLGRPSLILPLCALPLAGLILWLAADQFHRQRTALLTEMIGLTTEQQFVVVQMLGDADRQVGRMRMAIEDGVRMETEPTELSPTFAVVAGVRIEGVEGQPGEAGALLGVSDLSTRPDAGPVTSALSMLRTVEVEAQLGSRSHWSYFFSAQGDFITIHPRVSLQDIAASSGVEVASVAELIGHWLDYDVFRLGTPEANPDRQTYWTPVYEDAGGAGQMISHAAPVYDGDRFLGIVGIDMLLTTFQSSLSHLRQPIGFTALTSEGGQVLATAGASFGGDAAQMVDRLTAMLPTLPADAAPVYRRVGEDWVLARPIPGTPFRLLSVLPDAEVTRHLLPRLAVFGWILLGLVVTLVALSVLLSRFYIRPAFALGDYLVRRTEGGAVEAPRLPGIWQGNLTRISDAYTAAEGYRDQLEQSEARLLAATSSLPEGFAIVDGDGRIVMFNAASQRLLGCEDNDALRVGCTLTHVPNLNGLDQMPSQVGASWISCSRTATPDGGQVIILRDVTLSHDADARLRESEALFRNVVDMQTEFVTRFTPDGRPTFANKAYCRYMNATMDELVSRGISDFTWILPEDRPEHDARLAQLTPENPTCTVTFRSVLEDGSFHWEEWRDTGIFDPEGRLIELQAVGRDITERKQAEEALRQSEKMAALGSLLAGVAHELNNPLSVVVGYAGMLEELAADEATRRRAREIHLAAERCARIVRTFLAMARSRPSERTSVNLPAVIDEALELAAYGLRSNGVQVSVEADNLPPVQADRDELHQVFMNLILNAQQAMMGMDGARQLSIRGFQEEDRAVVTLTDTGHGIAAADKPRLFDPFFTTKPQGVGTGIGLSVCLRIVEAHGGEIRLEAAPGGGAVARVELPVGSIVATDDAAPELTAVLRGHVLVVDDEPGITGWIDEALTAAGLTVVTCNSVSAAQSALARQVFDAVLTDLRMPDGGGERLAAHIETRLPGLADKVIVMTGDALGAEISLGFSVAGVIEKPVEVKALLAFLARILANTSQEAAK